MVRVLKKSIAWVLSIVTVIFTITPESLFEKFNLLLYASAEVNVVLTRVIVFIAVLVFSVIINVLHLLCRRSIRIKGNNYSIQIKFGDLFRTHTCKKVIPFDECFTTAVGEAPGDNNPGSVCGQYLTANPINDDDMHNLINNNQLIPAESNSAYQDKDRYESGKILPNGDYLLMAFAKLDKDGLGGFSTRDEFLDCLSTLWKEIDKYYGQNDVCIPVLGSGSTRMEGSPTQQELLDIIIASYKLSAHKIKPPCQLRIICKKRDGFSLNNIGASM